MALTIRSKTFGVEVVNALDSALLGLSELDRLGVIDPQEAANLTSRFLNLKAQVLRALDLYEEAQVFERLAVQVFTQPTLWDEAS